MKLKYILIGIGILTIAHAMTVSAAPTSTIVTNLFINALKSTPTAGLTINSAGLVATGTVGSSGGLATSSPTSGFAVFQDGNTLTGTSSLVTSFNGATGSISYAPSTTIPISYVSALNALTGSITISIVSTSSQSSVTTVSPNIFLNLLRYSSSSQITVSPSGTINFASINISQFTNDSGYLTSVSTTIPTKTSQLSNDRGFVASSSISGVAPIIWSSATGSISCPSCLTSVSSSIPSLPVSIANGGTGTTTAPLGTQILSNNGANYALKNLVAGSNITITSDTVSVTITGSAGGSGSIGTSSALVAGQWVVASAYNTIYSTSTQPALANQACGGTDKISSISATGTIVCTTDSGGSGTPAGASKDIQFNSSTQFGADTGLFIYATSSRRMSLLGSTSSVQIGTSTNFYTQLPAIAGQSSSTVFDYVGGPVPWVVPSGVTSIQMQLWGARGGDGDGPGGQQTNVGAASGTLAVNPGDTLYVLVGAQATSAAGTAFGGAPPGNLNGGGATVAAGSDYTGVFNSATLNSSTVFIMVGGGGGIGNTNQATSEGSGGGLTGVQGHNGPGPTIGGGGGTQSAGGAGGAGPNQAGTAGSSFQGGKGGDGAGAGWAGGGGGGGWYGGGGGGGILNNSAAGGGGGSGFVSSTLTATSSQSGATSTSAGNNNGQIKFFYTIAGISATNTPSITPTSTPSLAVGGPIILGGTQSSTVSGCGTSPLIIGSENGGVVTAGTGSVTSCTINLMVRYQFIPGCIATDNSSTVAIACKRTLTATTTVLTLTAASSFGSDEISYWVFQPGFHQ